MARDHDARSLLQVHRQFRDSAETKAGVRKDWDMYIDVRSTSQTL